MEITWRSRIFWKELEVLFSTCQLSNFINHLDIDAVDCQLLQEQIMKCINRMALTIKPKQPFLDWINAFPDDDTIYTLEQISQDNTVYLIPEFDNDEKGIKYLKKIYEDLFVEKLWGWVEDEEYLPENRTWKMFLEWFDIDICSEVVDWVDGVIEKEEM